MATLEVAFQVSLGIADIQDIQEAAFQVSLAILVLVLTLVLVLLIQLVQHGEQVTQLQEVEQ